MVRRHCSSWCVAAAATATAAAAAAAADSQWSGLGCERPCLRDAHARWPRGAQVYDHNKVAAANFSLTLLSDPLAAQWVDGIAVSVRCGQVLRAQAQCAAHIARAPPAPFSRGQLHWYDYRSSIGVAEIQQIAAAAPSKWMLGTEASWIATVQHSWAVGELYALDILADLANGVIGCVSPSPFPSPSLPSHVTPSLPPARRWTDWNVLLDVTGGPNHINRTDIGAPILLLPNGTLEFQPSYFYMGHVSRWVQPGAVRVNLTSPTGLLAVAPADVDALSHYVQSNAAEGAVAGDGAPSAVLMGGAFLSSDGTSASAVFMNPGPTAVAFKLQDVAIDGSVRATTVTLPARAIQTLVYGV
jgi:O-glycosyl hydrolase